MYRFTKNVLMAIKFLVFLLGYTLNQQLPVQGITYDLCGPFEFLDSNEVCIKCPINCEQCYLENTQVKCSSCNKGYYYIGKTVEPDSSYCEQTCQEGYRADPLSRQCIQCSIRFCQHCEKETENSKSCNKCQDQFILDESNNYCIKECFPMLFDEISGNCVDKCSDRQMRSKNMCIQNVDCPFINSVQNICSMSKILKILPHPNGKSLIAVGTTNINIFGLPSFLLAVAHTLEHAYQLLDCSILQADVTNMYCFNSVQQVVKYSLDDLSETVVAEAKGYFRGIQDLQNVILSSQILIASTSKLIEKIDVISGRIWRQDLTLENLKEVYSGIFWKERNLVVHAALNQDYSYCIVLFQADDSTQNLTVIPFDESKSFLVFQRILTIDKNQIIFQDTAGILFCTITVEDITSQDDFICLEESIIQFDKDIYFGNLQLISPQNVITYFSPSDRYLYLLDYSKGMNQISVLGEFSDVLAYLFIENLVLLVDVKSVIRVITLHEDDPFTEFSSIPLVQSYATSLQGILLYQDKLIFNDQYAIFYLNISSPSGLSFSHEQIIKPILSNPLLIPIQDSSKCVLPQQTNIIYDVYVLTITINSQNQQFLLFIHPYSIACRSFFSHSGANSFYKRFNPYNGKIQETTYFKEYQLLVVMQTSYLSVLDLKTHMIVFTMDNYKHGIICPRINFLDKASFAVECFSSSSSSQVLTILNLGTLQVTNISLAASLWYSSSKKPMNYFFVVDQDNFVSKYSSNGELLENFKIHTTEVYSQSYYLDNLIQVVQLEMEIQLFNLQTQTVIFTLDTSNISNQDLNFAFFVTQSSGQLLLNAVFPSDDNEISQYQWDELGNILQKTTYICPGQFKTLTYEDYLDSESFYVIKSANESLLCVLDLSQKTIQYFENIPKTVNLSSFKSTEGDVFLVIARQDLTEIYIKARLQSYSQKKLLKMIDLPVDCAAVRQYDKNNGICIINRMYSSNAVFFPFQKKLIISQMPMDFEVTEVVFFDYASFAFGLRKIILQKKEQILFEYEMSIAEAGDSVIKDAYFYEDTKQVILLWSNQVIQFFQLPYLGSTISEIRDFTNFLVLGYSSRIVIYVIQNESAITLSFYNLTSYSIQYQQTIDTNFFEYKWSLLESQQIFYLLIQNSIFRYDLNQGEVTSQISLELTKIKIDQVISSEKYFLIVLEELEEAIILDPKSLSLLDIKITGLENFKSIYCQNKFVAISSDKSIGIVSVPALQQIIIYALPSFEKIIFVDYKLQYKILHTDFKNKQICILFSDKVLNIYDYTSYTDNSKSTVPFFSLSIAEYLYSTAGYTGTSFLNQVSARIVAKYQAIIIRCDNSIRIHSLADGSLRYLIKEDNYSIRDFHLYFNNYILSYGKQGIRFFNIEHAFFINQQIDYKPFRYKPFVLPIAHNYARSDSDYLNGSNNLESDILSSFQLNLDDPKQSNIAHSFGEVVSFYPCDTCESSQLLDASQPLLEFVQDSSPLVSLPNIPPIADPTGESFKSHRIYYITQAYILQGVKGTDIFKTLQLFDETGEQESLDRFFFLSKKTVIILKKNVVLIFSHELEIIQTQSMENSLISKVIAVPSEINSEKFIFLSENNDICIFNIPDNSFSILFHIPSDRGIISYYFFLTPSLECSVLIIGFSDGSLITINLESFQIVLSESSTSPIYSKVFSQMKRFFTSSTFIYLVDSESSIIAVQYNILNSVNLQGQTVSTLELPSDIIPLDGIKSEQFFFDASRQRLIFFSSDSAFFQYTYLKQTAGSSNSSPASFTFRTQKSNILKPTSDNTLLLVNSNLDIYIFYGNMYILIIYSTEMQLRAFISDPQIKGDIRSVYPLNSDIFIITTSIHIYTLVFLPPSNSQILYFIANSFQLTNAHILFYQFQKSTQDYFSNIYLASIEGVSSEGPFAIQFPINTLHQKANMECMISFSITEDLMVSKLFLNRLDSIQALDSVTPYQIYDIEHFIMKYSNRTENFFIYLKQKRYQFFRAEGINQGAIMKIYPQSIYSKNTGENFHIKTFHIQWVRTPNDSAILIPNKIFSGYLTYFMEDVIFENDNLGYQLSIHSIEYIQMHMIDFTPSTLSLDPSVIIDYPYDLVNILSQSENKLFEKSLEMRLTNEIISEYNYSIEDANNEKQYVFTSFNSYWKSTKLVSLTQITYSGIFIKDFSSMVSLINCNKVYFEDITAVSVTFFKRYYFYQQIMFFMKINTIEINNLTFNAITLSDAGFLTFIQIGKLIIRNLTITNVTCSIGSTLPEYLLDFKGVQDLTIERLYISEVKNCLLINVQTFQNNNVKVVSQNVILNDLKVTNVRFSYANIINSLSPQISIILEGTGTQNQTDSDNLVVSASSYSMINIDASNIAIRNFTIDNFIIKYAQLLTCQSNNLNLTMIRISSTIITALKFSSIYYPAIQLFSDIILAQDITSIQNTKVDFSISALQQASFSGMDFIDNTHSLLSYKEEIFGLLSFYSTPLIEITHSIFSNNTGEMFAAGVLKFLTISKLILENCTFYNNTAKHSHGGAINVLYSNGIQNYFKDCKFVRNSSPNHSGGAIYFLNSDVSLENCLFQGNYAMIGGAIRLISQDFFPKFYNSYQNIKNVYLENQAFIYGKNVGLYPSVVVSSDVMKSLNEIGSSTTGTSKELNQIEIQNYKSGDTLKDLSLIILDNENNQIRFANYTSLTHKDVIEEVSKYHLTLNLNPNQQVFIPSVQISLNQLNHQFDVSLNLYINPSVNETLLLKSSLKYPYVNEKTSELVVQEMQFKINVQSRLCEIGEIYSPVNQIYQCFSCPDGKYSFEQPVLDQPNKVTCNICPNSAVKCETNQIHLKNGFWRENDTSEEIYPCLKLTMNCKAEDPLSKQLCGEGSIGPLCQSCDNYGKLWGDSYARFADSSCQNCSQMPVNYVFLVIFILVILAYVLVLVWQNYSTISQKIIAITLIQLRCVRMGRSAIFYQFTTLSKIFMNYLQLIIILAELEVSLPDYLQFVQIGDPVVTVIHSIDCILAQMPRLNIVYWRVLWIFLFQFLLALTITGIFLYSYLQLLSRQKKKRQERQKLQQQINSSLPQLTRVNSKLTKNCSGKNNNDNNQEDPINKTNINLEKISSKEQQEQQQQQQSQLKNQLHKSQDAQVDDLQSNNSSRQQQTKQITIEPKNKQSGDVQKKHEQFQYQNLEKSLNVPYFKVESKYFQWYQGYIKMSLKLLFFYIQPGLVKMLVSSLQCVQYGSQSYIYSDTQFLCDSSFRTASILFFLPSLLLIGLIFPLIILYQLKKFKNKQFSFNFLKSYGFFFIEYKRRAYYWEILRMFFKSLISCVMVFFNPYVQLKLILQLLIIAFYIFLQIKVQPYRQRQLNKLDYYSHAVVIISLTLGLLVYSTDILWLKILAWICIASCNSLFIWTIFKESLSAVTLPYDAFNRTRIENILYFLKLKLPFFFGEINVRKPFSCKVLIMWRRLSTYVHSNKHMLVQESQDFEAALSLKQKIISSFRLDKSNMKLSCMDFSMIKSPKQLSNKLKGISMHSSQFSVQDEGIKEIQLLDMQPFIHTIKTFATDDHMIQTKESPFQSPQRNEMDLISNCLSTKSFNFHSFYEQSPIEASTLIKQGNISIKNAQTPEKYKNNSIPQKQLQQQQDIKITSKQKPILFINTAKTFDGNANNDGTNTAQSNAPFLLNLPDTQGSQRKKSPKILQEPQQQQQQQQQQQMILSLDKDNKSKETKKNYIIDKIQQNRQKADIFVNNKIQGSLNSFNFTTSYINQIDQQFSNNNIKNKQKKHKNHNNNQNHINLPEQALDGQKSKELLSSNIFDEQSDNTSNITRNRDKSQVSNQTQTINQELQQK